MQQHADTDGIEILAEEPWHRLPAEPPRWFLRFERFRLMGPRRSVDEVWRQEGAERRKGQRPSGAWFKQVKRWRWADRAAAWDLAEAERLAQEEAEGRQRAREVRRGLLKVLSGKLSAALAQMDAGKMSPFALVLAIRATSKEMRAEFDEEPTQRHQLGGWGGGPLEITLDLTPPRDYLGDGEPPDLSDGGFEHEAEGGE